MYRNRIVIAWLALALSIAPSLEAEKHSLIAEDPAAARLVFDDIDLFWRAWDEAAATGDLAEALRSRYLAEGSPGVAAFARMKFDDAERLAETIEAHHDYYSAMRRNSLEIARYEPEIRDAYRHLAELYPEAVYPPIYFVVGALNSGGSPDEDKLIIGAEMYSRGDNTPVEGLNHWLQAVLTGPEQIPAIVVHELIHFQQAATREVIWEVDWGDPAPLLHIALVEGAADFLAQMIVGRHINPAAAAYGDAHEAALWREFQEAMHDNDYSRWLYNSSRIEDRPADLGYYVGRRVVESYYDRQPDKRQAIREILQLRDFEGFLAASGYSGASAEATSVPASVSRSPH